MKRLKPRQRVLLALWSGISTPFVIMGLFCGCGSLMDNHAPPPAKQILQGVDVVGSVVIGAATAPVWIPVVIGMNRDLKKQNERERANTSASTEKDADSKTAAGTTAAKKP